MPESVLLVGASVLALLVIGFAQRISEVWARQLVRLVTIRVSEKVDAIESGVARLGPTSEDNPAIQKQRQKIASIDLKAFSYLNEPLVSQLFSQADVDMFMAAKEEEQAKSMGGGLQAVFQGIGLKGDASRSSNTRAKYETTPSRNSLEKNYNVVESRLISRNSVTFGIETFYFDEDQQARKIESIESQLSSLPDGPSLTGLTPKAFQQAEALERLRYLTSVTGYVAVNGIFFQSPGPTDDMVTLRMDHPANNFISNSVQAALTRAYIDIDCQEEHFTGLGKSQVLQSYRVPLTVFGLARWDDVRTAVVIAPIAIYQ